jgi:hypothetical protein
MLYVVRQFIIEETTFDIIIIIISCVICIYLFIYSTVTLFFLL